MIMYLIIDKGDEERPYLGAPGMQPIAFTREEDAQHYVSADESLEFMPVYVTSPDLAADARKPYADVLKAAQAASEDWLRQADQLQREVVFGVRGAERAAGLRTAAHELQNILGLEGRS